MRDGDELREKDGDVDDSGESDTQTVCVGTEDALEHAVVERDVELESLGLFEDVPVKDATEGDT